MVKPIILTDEEAIAQYKHFWDKAPSASLKGRRTFWIWKFIL